MSSQINPNNIDGTFPVAGQDNNSQGFRDNFTNTKNNLTFAKSEIEDLQSKVLLKSALTGTSLDNDLSGAVISNATVKGFRNTKYDLGSVSGSQAVNFSNGSFQTLTTGGSVTISAINNWPNTSGTATILTLGITISDALHTITFPSTVSMGSAAGVTSKTITFSSTGTYFFDLISMDGGSSYYLVDKTRTYSTVQSSLTVNGNITFTGSSVESLQVEANVANAGNVTLSSTTSSAVITTNANIASFTVYMPTSPANGQKISLGFGGNIASLTQTVANANAQSISGALTSATPSTAGSWVYRSANTTWYRIG